MAQELPFDVDDRNFRTVIVDEDNSENPFNTRSLQGVLRNHRYSLNPNARGYANAIANEEHVVLPPLKLPNMNVVVDMMVDRAINSVRDEAEVCVFEREHPGLFAWDALLEGMRVSGSDQSVQHGNDQSVQEMSDQSLQHETDQSLQHGTTQERSGSTAYWSDDDTKNPTGLVVDTRGAAVNSYLNMQAIEVSVPGGDITHRLKNAKGILCQFMSFYMDYVIMHCDDDEGVNSHGK